MGAAGKAYPAPFLGDVTKSRYWMTPQTYFLPQAQHENQSSSNGAVEHAACVETGARHHCLVTEKNEKQTKNQTKERTKNICVIYGQCMPKDLGV